MRARRSIDVQTPAFPQKLLPPEVTDVRLPILGVLALAELAAPTLALAQPAEQPAQPEPPPQPEKAPDETEALRQELAAQREAIAEQQRQIEELRAAQEDAQLEATLADAGEEGPGASEIVPSEPLELYGFMDMGLQRTWGNSTLASRAGSTAATFVLGNVNLYIDAEPVPDWRALTEFRLTLFPLGSETLGTPLAPYSRVDTTVVDITSGGGGVDTVQWSALVLERAHIDWTASDWLTLRTGYFLTPYGIWNVDHGTPTLITLTFPAFIVIDLWPQHQLGVEALGKLLSPPWTFGYHLYVSNGRMLSQVDFTDDKAIGGRLFAATTRPVRAQLGVSAFAGRVVDITETVVNPVTLRVREEVVYAYDEQGVAADLSVDVGSLRLRGEVLMRQVFYDQDLREPRFDFGIGADRREWGAYVMAGYRLPWLGLEPHTMVDFLRWPTPIGEAIISPSIGTNIHFTTATQMKLQDTVVQFFDIEDVGHDHSNRRMHFVNARLVMAY